MTDLHWTDGKTTIVVPASVRGRFSGSAKAFQRLVCAIAVVVATVLGSMWITADAYADDSSSTGTDANSSVTITDNITDTENLLGSHATEVSDAIAKTEKETGVHVHLLYLSSFNSEQTPQKWASTVLESTKPKANTVLLAVAALSLQTNGMPAPPRLHRRWRLGPAHVEWTPRKPPFVAAPLAIEPPRW